MLSQLIFHFTVLKSESNQLNPHPALIYSKAAANISTSHQSFVSTELFSRNRKAELYCTLLTPRQK